MAENDDKIEYSQAEQLEIDKIVKYVSQETIGLLSTTTTPAHTEIIPSISMPEQKILERPIIPERYEGIPEEPEMAEPEEVPGYIESKEEEIQKIQDITGLIHEIKEEEIPEKSAEPTEISFEETFPEEQVEEPAFPEEISEILEKEFPEIQPVEEKEIKAAPEEPSEFDIGSITEELERHFDETSEEALPEELRMPPTEDLKSLEEESEQLLEADAQKRKRSEKIIPAVEEPESIEAEDVQEKEVYDTGLEEIKPTEELYAKPGKLKAPEIEEELPDFDIETPADLKKSEKKKAETPPPKISLGQDLPDIVFDEEEEKKPSRISEDIERTRMEEELEAEKAAGKDEIDLSNSELQKLNKTIRFFHPNLTKIIKDVIINDLLPRHEIRQLVDMLLKGESEQEVQSHLENKLNKKIDISAKAAPKRRVITARAEYTAEGRERLKRLYKNTGIFVACAVVIFLISVFSYYKIYIPVMAKRNIDEGVQLIKKPGVPVIQKQKDYKKAEEIFHTVDENYIKDYMYGYHSYARAYFQNKEYDYALEKLNKAYEINAANVEILNDLGFFYSKIPETKFDQIKGQLKKYYYTKITPVGPIDKQIDVAVDFYRKALNIDPNNITSMYGIGNAYTYMGEYMKARQYYENILAVDKKSVIGYSGLLNLYIERDALAEIISIHTDLGYDERLSEVPSALLAKLASYYLSKTRTDENNIRIDYGVQSPAIKDFGDNPFPAVKNILEALAKRDIDYPPLYLQFARLSKAEKNIALMQRNLKTALEKEPDYFAAHILLAEYYYETNDPVEAYKSSKKAIESYLSPPEFTNDDFYYETEKIGTAYAIQGNIFYYSENAKFRFGDEFEEGSTQEKNDQMANYAIAQDKYEKAMAENYKSGEVFYNLGRLYYIKGQYDKATNTWLNLYEDFTAQPELMFALGNAFYHQNNYEESKGEYYKVISVFESKAENIKQVFPERNDHIKIFKTLSSAYNNLGVVYQVQNSESKSSICYWKSIDYAKKLDYENEFARVNLAREFKGKREKIMPILDENIPENIEVYQDFR